MTPITVLLPLRIVSVANLREHWSEKARRTGRQRSTALHCVTSCLSFWPCVAPPLLVTLTRIAPRTLDDDNLASAFKAARDGVADALKIDDGDRRVTWTYAQRRGKPHEYAAEVRIEAGDG